MERVTLRDSTKQKAMQTARREHAAPTCVEIQ